MFLDLDGFKQINDVYGHAIGDLLLRAVGKRVQECIRGIDTLARIGGDEFVLLLMEVNVKEDAIKVADKILQRIAEGFLIDNKKFLITLSVGISLYPEDGDKHQLLLEKADAAMYYVKKQGKNNLRLFNSDET